MRIEVAAKALGLVLGLLLLTPFFAAAQQVDLAPATDGEGAALEAAVREVESYRFSAGDGAEADFKLNVQPLLRYTNPVTGAANGFVFAWLGKTRPEVISALYQFPGRPASTEMHSLSMNKISAVRDDGQKWSPAKPGVSFQPVLKAKAPARSKPGRRIQLGQMAKRFAVERIELDGAKIQLRLLSTPLLRYGRADSTVLDGAIFAFVQGTNPDTLLLLEARRSGGGYRWDYSLARLIHRQLRATLDDEIVWTTMQLTNAEKEDRRGIYTIFRRPQAR